ncbi:IS3 family transposase [Leucobacter denitrificans]|uniref:IS3 family transposase n=1 Tax=Leucobacter denitrificans TaxID=683042 RepID=A0A7G9S7A5_9MICO|nr:IS3 family transposase [Leucobacter denitrificans]QNN63724.1 IS3 family transposase [Leucobacter denitrificans]QNN63730.1 IS3 family transposase [Leucobacter denitrificans]
MPMKYSEEFKRDAVALVESGIAQKTVCKDLGVSKSALGAWVQDSRFKTYGMSPSKDPDEQREMRQALKRIRELEMENEVLRRAAAYLSQVHINAPKIVFPLVREMAAAGARVRVPVAVACRVLGFSEQAYYQWLASPRSTREIEEEHLIGVLHELHEEDPEGGYRVLADDLHDLGYQISERRVWRLCKIAGIQSVITKRKRRYQQAGAPVGDDLVERDFTAEYLDEKWLTDLTEHWTSEGKLYLCAIKDVCSNKIVGYAIDKRMKASLAVRALENALMQRGYPQGVVVHSGRGSQFRSRKFQQALKRHKLKGSMGRVGACGDNAAMESFFSLLQKNVLDRQSWRTRQELRLAIVSWIEGKYHRKRRQRRLGKLTPVEFEAIMMDAVALAA